MATKTAKGGAEARTIRKALKGCPGGRLSASNLREIQGELRLDDMSGATFEATVRGMPDVRYFRDRQGLGCTLVLV